MRIVDLTRLARIARRENEFLCFLRIDSRESPRFALRIAGPSKFCDVQMDAAVLGTDCWRSLKCLSWVQVPSGAPGLHALLNLFAFQTQCLQNGGFYDCDPDCLVQLPNSRISPKSGVALEQETFSGLPGHPPKRLLAPSPIDLGAIQKFGVCTREAGLQYMHS